MKNDPGTKVQYGMGRKRLMKTRHQKMDQLVLVNLGEGGQVHHA